MRHTERRRRAAALGLSLAVHALVFGWLLTPSRPADLPPPVPAPVHTRLVWIDAPPAVPPVDVAHPQAASSQPEGAPPPRASPGLVASPASAPEVGASRPQAASSQAVRAPPPRASPGSAGAPGASASRPPPSRSGPTSGESSWLVPPAGDGLRDGAPRATTLLPGPDALGVPSGEADARGRTVYPSDLPGTDELLAEEEARVHARVDGWARRVIAAARVRGGLPDPAYGQLGQALREATAEVPKFIDTNSASEVGRAVVDSWQAGAQRYGATGAPYDEPEGRLEAIEKPGALAQGAAAGSPDAIALSQFFAAGARLQDFADGRTGAELYALVEIRQQGSGAVDSVTLLRPSGVLPFDRWVTAQAGTVAKGFLVDAGARATPYRSVWRFDGLVTFRRKVNLSELDGRAALGMMTMATLSLLSGLGNTMNGPNGPTQSYGPRVPAFVGRFDELTGEVDVVDLTNPTYDCRVTLLEAD